MGTGENPHVTILMATYNGKRYLADMIESILHQDYDNWRLVISDDGSDDGTVEIIERYAAAYPEKIARHVSGRRFGGACRHFMYLMERVTDDYIMLCDQDDVWHSDKISLTMRKMAETEKGEDMPVLVHTDLRVVDSDIYVISESFFKYSDISLDRVTLPRLIVQNIVTGCTVMANRRLAELAVSNRADEKIVMHDWWLALCAAALGKIAFVNSATIDYRQHGSNSVGAGNVHSAGYIVRKIAGGGVSESIKRAMEQAAALGDSFSGMMSRSDSELCCICGETKNMGKIKRIRTYIKYGLMPEGILRKIKLMIWG